MLGKRKQISAPALPRIAGWDSAQLRTLLDRLATRHAMFNLMITGHEYTLRVDERGAQPQDTFIGRLNYPPASVEGTMLAETDQDHGFGRVMLTEQYGIDGGASTPHVDVVMMPQGLDRIATIRDAVRTSLGRGGQAWVNMKLQLVTDPALEVQHMAERGYSSSLTVEHMIFGTSVGEVRP
jgi:hypothetical protein